MHTAAMKPSYITKDEVPQDAIDQAIEESKEQTIAKLKEGMPEKAKEKAIEGSAKIAVSMLNKRDVLMEQELITGGDNETVAKFLEAQSKELGCTVEIKDWALF